MPKHKIINKLIDCVSPGFPSQLSDRERLPRSENCLRLVGSSPWLLAGEYCRLESLCRFLSKFGELLIVLEHWLQREQGLFLSYKAKSKRGGVLSCIKYTGPTYRGSLDKTYRVQVEQEGGLGAPLGAKWGRGGADGMTGLSTEGGGRVQEVVLLFQQKHFPL